MKDQECVSFLQWALPKLDFRWQGFRKVRKQVCKRINKRMKALHVNSVNDYREYLKRHEDEWEEMDKMSRITISRFYRDKHVYQVLERDILPVLTQTCNEENQLLNVWSIGSASGEEPYSLSIILDHSRSLKHGYEITATEVDDYLIHRAKKACYPKGAVKELPHNYLNNAFDESNDEFCLKENFKNKVIFLQQDIRENVPEKQFDLVLCRNLVSMYFNEELQYKIFIKIMSKMKNHGVLVLGAHEKLPEKLSKEFQSLPHEKLIYYRKKSWWKNHFNS